MSQIVPLYTINKTGIHAVSTGIVGMVLNTESMQKVLWAVDLGVVSPWGLGAVLCAMSWFTLGVMYKCKTEVSFSITHFIVFFSFSFF